MKIFEKSLKSVLFKIKVVWLMTILLITALSFNSCKRMSKAGRASLKKERSNNQIEPLKDTTNIVPKIIIPNTIPEDSVLNPNIPEDKNKKSKEIIIPGDIISGEKSVSQLFKELQTGVFMVYAFDEDGEGSQGSGFFINSDGIGITNYHVLEGHTNNYIKTSDGNKYRIIKILEKSKREDYDYVIFQIDSKGRIFNNLPISHMKIQIGEDVFVIGSPRELENTLTTGTVSQLRKNNRIQIDATIDHGSSGGPLFNKNGEVIGITTSGFSGSALNFAVDIQTVPYIKYISKSNKTALFHSHSSTFGQIIYHSYYTVSYNEDHEQAEWVAYKITVDNINNNVQRTNDYRDDPYVQTKSAHRNDYRGSGYDMGHLAPARTMSHNYKSMSESFYLSNISPQVKEFNRGIWKRLEQKVRYWSFFNDSTYVVTGPILDHPIEQIGYNNVSVPQAFYKALVGFKDGKVKGIAFIMPNKGSDRSIYSYATSIDYVEDITGIDFFYNLDKIVQDRIEANSDLKKWSLK